MKEKLQAISGKITTIHRKIFYPLLGNIGLSKENRVAVEIGDDFISVCKFDGKNQIKKFFNEKLEISNNGNIQDNQFEYENQISEIIKKNKLTGLEVNVVIPNSLCSIKSITMPVEDETNLDPEDMLYAALEKQTEDNEFWKTFNELSDLSSDKEISHQVVAKNEDTQEISIVVAITDKEKINVYKNILENCGLKPNIFEPKSFSIINSILINKEEKEPYNFGLFHYGKKDNYFIAVTNNSFQFIENEITRADKILLDQAEKLSDATGPFWTEVFERVFQTPASLIESDDFSEETDEANETTKDKMSEIYFYSDVDDTKNFNQALKNKFNEIKIKEISLSPVSNEDEGQIKENLFDSKKIKLDKKLQKTFPETFLDINQVYPIIGASLRYINPYNIKNKFLPKYNINLDSNSFKLIEQRKIKTSNYVLNMVLSLFLVIFGSIVYLNVPTYLAKSKTLKEHKIIVNQYDNAMKEIQIANQKFRNIDKESKIMNEVLNMSGQYHKVVTETPNIVPDGVKIEKIEFADKDHAIFEGHALTDYDLNVFLENLRLAIGNPDISDLNFAELQQELNQQDQTNEQDADNNDGDKIELFRKFKIQVNL